MTESLRGLAVVTGAGSGIGRALALQLVDDGCDLALCDINKVSLAETVELCRARRVGSRVSSMTVDVSDRTRLDEFAAAVAREHATTSIALLFNNAGVGGGASFVADEEVEWDRTFDITWGGVYRTTRAFLPMLVASTSANIINISSINGAWAALGEKIPVNAYATAKFAVKGFTEALQTDLRLHAPHVRATLVMPGSVSTSISSTTLAIHGREPSLLTPEQLVAERRRLHERGVDVQDLDDEALRQRLDEWKDSLRRNALLTPDQAATIILDAVRAGRWRVVVGDDAVALDRLMRWFPNHPYRWTRRRLGLFGAAVAPVRSARALGPVVVKRLRSRWVRRWRSGRLVR